MSTCRTCANWTVVGMPRWAFRLGMACCSLSNSRAVTLNHWAACHQWRAAPATQLPEREQWLARCSSTTTPRSGSFQVQSHAGNWNREVGLLQGVAKGVDPT